MLIINNAIDPTLKVNIFQDVWFVFHTHFSYFIDTAILHFLRSPRFCGGVRIAQSLVFCVVFNISLYCLPFLDLRFVITPLLPLKC
jgi:hypothetical protein